MAWPASGERRGAPPPAPRIHFLEGVAKVRDVFTHQELDFQDDAARIEVTFGQYRRKITLRVSMNKPGLTPVELRHALGRAWALIEQKLGRRVAMEEFGVDNLHLSLDFLHLSLEGYKSVTLADADTWLRLYEKGDALRSEAVLSGGVLTLDKALDLMATTYGDRKLLQETHAGVQQILAIVTAQRIGSEPRAASSTLSGTISPRTPRFEARVVALFGRLLRAGLGRGLRDEGSSAKTQADVVTHD
jgi:hypothetical protein